MGAGEAAAAAVTSTRPPSPFLVCLFYFIHLASTSEDGSRLVVCLPPILLLYCIMYLFTW